MRELVGWNINLGRWFGVQVRLHATFVLVAAIALLLARHQQTDVLWTLCLLGILFVSVLAHELGHCLAAARLGGTPGQIILGPLGGLAHVSVPSRPGCEFFVAVAGPLVNLMICLVASSALFWQDQQLLTSLHPLLPPVGEGANVTGLLKLTLWVNLWLLFIINMLPAMPLDGGRALRAVLWYAMDLKWAMYLSARVTQVTGVALCAAGWWTPPFAQLPIILLGILLFFVGKQDAEKVRAPHPEDWPEGLDLAAGGAAGRESEPLSREEQLQAVVEEDAQEFDSWLDQHEEQQSIQRRQREQEEDRRVDEILGRVQEVGLEGLSPEEQDLLRRAGQRYRNRSQS